MIKKTENGFSIHIDADGSPADFYVGMTNNMIDFLQRKKEICPDADDYYGLELLRAMLPDYDAAKTLFPDADPGEMPG